VFPAALQDQQVDGAQRRIPLRPEILGSKTPATALTKEGEPARGNVLVTFGTVFTDPGIRERVAGSLDRGLWNIEITVGADPRAPLPESSPTRRYVPFTPLAELLPGKHVIVTAGGAGTVLSALTAGIPMVIYPQGADHDINAARAQAAGVALVVHDPDDVGDAVQRIVSDQAYCARSSRIAASISALPSAGEVALLLEREVLEHHERSRH
jgi:UDP:flavonoid glycosyltransferase YjiC (YdhE family)